MVVDPEGTEYSGDDGQCVGGSTNWRRSYVAHTLGVKRARRERERRWSPL
jgi:hypothetical protein